MAADLSTLPDPEVSEDEGFLLASLAPVETGLPMTIWLYSRSAEPQAPYVRVSSQPGWPAPTHEVVTLMVEDPPRVVHGELDADDLARVGVWLQLNRDIVADYWRHGVDAFGLVRRLRSLPGDPTPQPRVG